MKIITGYLVFKRDRFARLTRMAPSLAHDERAIKIMLNVPQELFDPVIPACEITVDATKVKMPPPVQVQIDVPAPELGGEAQDA